MQRRITGFFKNERDRWTARLDCGHTRTIRHNPPWVNRRWVLREDSRRRRIGSPLNCKACDQDSEQSAEPSPQRSGPTVHYRGRRPREDKSSPHGAIERSHRH